MSKRTPTRGQTGATGWSAATGRPGSPARTEQTERLAFRALTVHRARQALAWTWHLIDAGLRERFRNDDKVRGVLPSVLRDVEAGKLTPTAAAVQLLSASQGE